MLAEDNQRRLKEALQERACAERTAFITEVASQIALGISTITAVASGFYNIPTLVFITASLNTLSGALARYAVSSKRTAGALALLAEKLSQAEPEPLRRVESFAPAVSCSPVENEEVV